MSAKLPRNLDQLCNLGMPCGPEDPFYILWDNCWNQENIAICSRPVVRDSSPITCDPPIPSKCFVMEKFHDYELGAFWSWATDVYVRDSFLDLAGLFIESYGGHYDASPSAKEVFENPFVGFQATTRKITMVLGSPGSGRTMFLYFLLRCRLHAKLPTILQLDGAGFFLFSDSGVHEFTSAPFPAIHASYLGNMAPDTWCLVDTDDENKAPSAFLKRSMLSVIQFSLPCQSAINWAQKSSLYDECYFMPPFSLREAVIARHMQVPSVCPSERQLHEWFEKYAPSARLAYKYAANIPRYEKTLFRLLLGMTSLGSLPALFSDTLSFRADGLGYQLCPIS